uniref:Uncharacterized protein n=1 Tax=mine drainage metagenome TaxID=410659 RepID=E6QKD0_9ZZZZ
MRIRLPWIQHTPELSKMDNLYKMIKMYILIIFREDRDDGAGTSGHACHFPANGTLVEDAGRAHSRSSPLPLGSPGRAPCSNLSIN